MSSFLVNSILAATTYTVANDAGSETYLYRAFRCGLHDLVKALIEAGADVNAANKNGETPLCAATLFGYTDIAKALIEAGRMSTLPVGTGIRLFTLQLAMGTRAL